MGYGEAAWECCNEVAAKRRIEICLHSAYIPISLNKFFHLPCRRNVAYSFHVFFFYRIFSHTCLGPMFSLAF